MGREVSINHSTVRAVTTSAFVVNSSTGAYLDELKYNEDHLLRMVLG